MVRIELLVPSRTVLFSEGYFQSQRINHWAKRLHSDSLLTDHMRSTLPGADNVDQRLAWVLNAYARRYATSHGYSPETLPLTTAVILPPATSDGRLAGWFAGQSMPNASYRLTLHVKPDITAGPLISHGLWDNAYRALHARHRRDKWSDRLAEGTYSFLRSVGQVAPAGLKALGRLFEQSGHPYYLCHDGRDLAGRS